MLMLLYYIPNYIILGLLCLEMMIEDAWKKRREKARNSKDIRTNEQM